MDHVELIIKAYFYSEPEAKKLRARSSVIEMILVLHGWYLIADLGLSGVLVYSSKSGKQLITIRRW